MRRPAWRSWPPRRSPRGSRCGRTSIASRTSATWRCSRSTFPPASGGDGTLGVEGARPLSEAAEPIELQLLFDAALHPVRDPLARVDGRGGGWLGMQGRVDPRISLSVQIPVTLREDGDLSAL